MINVEELIYPDDTPLADVDVAEDATEVELFRPSGETIPVRLFLPEMTGPRVPIIIQFSADDEQIERQMLDEVEALYSIYGTPIFRALSDSIIASDPQSTRLRNRKLGMGQVPEEEVIASPPYAKVQIALGRAQATLQKQLQKTLNSVQKTAQKNAEDRLNKSKKQILVEAQRYLSGATNEDKAKTILAAAADTTELSGRDAAQMMRAMLEIQTLTDQSLAAWETVERAFTNDLEPYLNTMEQMILRSMLTDEAVAVHSPNAAQESEEAQNDLILALAVHCEDYPILYRLVGQARLPRDTTFHLQPASGNYIAKSKGAGAGLLGSFKRTVYTELKNAWQAANALEEALKKQGDLVWRYPNIIDQALLILDIDPESSDARAVEERVEQAQGSSTASIIATSAGVVEMIVLLAGAAPPVAAVVGILATLASMPEVIEAYRNAQQQENAYRAVLNPNESLASDASYASFMFSLVSLLPGFADLRLLGPTVKVL